MAGAASAPGNVATLLGHDADEWVMALICAFLAAVIYEVTMTLTRTVTLRIPFLILQLARIAVCKDLRADLYDSWKSELWIILRRRDSWWLHRFVEGLMFATGLAFFGARATVQAAVEARTVPTMRERWSAKLVVLRRGVKFPHSEQMDMAIGAGAAFITVGGAAGGAWGPIGTVYGVAVGTSLAGLHAVWVFVFRESMSPDEADER